MLKRNLQNLYGYLDLRDSFFRFDRDHNGKLDKEEVTLILENIVKALDDPAYPVSKSETISKYIEHLISKCDKDGDSMISFQEYRSLENEIRAIFRK